MIYLVTFLVVAVIGLALALIRAQQTTGTETKPKEWWFERTPGPMTANELRLFRCLEIVADGEFVIAPQVHLGALVKIRHGVRSGNAMRHRNALNRRVDFVLCDRELNTVGVVELDDKSHDVPDQAKRDATLDAILASAGIPIARIGSARFYEPQAIAAQIEAAFNERAAPTALGSAKPGSSGL